MKNKPINLAAYNSKIIEGEVISCGKMAKTIIVRVNRRVTHPLYKKTLNKYSKFHVHDEKQECSIGDLVQIKESRPISKTKAWVLLKIIEKSAEVEKVN